MYRSGQTVRFQEVEAPSLHDNRRMKVARLSGIYTGRLYPQFLLEAESTTGPHSGRKDYVSEKFE